MTARMTARMTAGVTATGMAAGGRGPLGAPMAVGEGRRGDPGLEGGLVAPA